LFDGLAERIEGIAFEDAASQRQIDDPDVVLVLKNDCLLNSCNDGAVCGGTILVQRSQIDDVSVRCDAVEGYVAISAARTASVARDDAGNVRPVSIQVVCGINGGIEILTVDNSANLAVAGLRQVPNGVHSAVDN